MTDLERLRLPCAGCGKEHDRADMLEAYIPHVEVFGGVVSRLAWVGPCCAALANQWQPEQPR